MNAGPEVVGVDQRGHRVQLVEQQLQPQLGGLVLDDEQQLVVGVGPGVLRGEHGVEAEVLRVAEVVAKVEVGVARRRRSRRRRACGSAVTTGSA